MNTDFRCLTDDLFLFLSLAQALQEDKMGIRTLEGRKSVGGLHLFFPFCRYAGKRTTVPCNRSERQNVPIAFCITPKICARFSAQNLVRYWLPFPRVPRSFLLGSRGAAGIVSSAVLMNCTARLSVVSKKGSQSALVIRHLESTLSHNKVRRPQ